MLRRFPLEVAKLVDTAALDHRPRPDLPDGAPQPRITVDDAEHRSTQTPRHQVVEAPFPGYRRLAAAQLQGQQVFAPVGPHPDHAEDRHAHHLPDAADAQREGVEVEVDGVHIGQRARLPDRQLSLQCGDDARDRALRERRVLEQGLERAANPARVASGQVGSHDRFIYGA